MGGQLLAELGERLERCFQCGQTPFQHDAVEGVRPDAGSCLRCQFPRPVRHLTTGPLPGFLVGQDGAVVDLFIHFAIQIRVDPFGYDRLVARSNKSENMIISFLWNVKTCPEFNISLWYCERTTYRNSVVSGKRVSVRVDFGV